MYSRWQDQYQFKIWHHGAMLSGNDSLGCFVTPAVRNKIRAAWYSRDKESWVGVRRPWFYLDFNSLATLATLLPSCASRSLTCRRCTACSVCINWHEDQAREGIGKSSQALSNYKAFSEFHENHNDGDNHKVYGARRECRVPRLAGLPLTSILETSNIAFRKLS